jgi:hypothetical protein
MRVINEDGMFYYRSITVQSKKCLVDPSELASLPLAIRKAHDAFLQAAAIRRRFSSYQDSRPPNDFSISSDHAFQ